MAFETKEPYVGTVDKKAKEIALRENFGWRYVTDSHHGRSGGLHIILERNTEMKNYTRISSLEQKYDSLKKQLKTYYPITDSPEMFLLILVFIFPFIIYCVYKSNQKQTIKENNEAISKQMDAVVKEAKSLLQQ